MGSSSFNAYEQWLGIPLSEQPPNFYRLLELPLFASDPAVITAAAEKQTARLQSHLDGSRATKCKQVIGQISTVKKRLLDADKKAAYDEQLRAMIPPTLAPEPQPVGAMSEPASAPQPPPVAAPPKPRQARAASPPQTSTPPSEECPEPDETLPPSPSPLSSPESRPEPVPPPAPGESVQHEPAATQTAQPPADDSKVTRQLGVYKLYGKLGSGGMGEVYRAVHTEMDREVAIKVLPPGHLKNERSVARFKREIKAVAKLKHPNIVEAYDAREVDGTRFLVMECVDGMSLATIAKRVGQLPVADACELIRQAAVGLQCAFEHGLVHRDIKPANLMLTPDGRIKLLDLGLARFESDPVDDELTNDGEAMGTADYMAPEQATDSRTVDIRGDIYSLGCALFYLLAGQTMYPSPQYKTPVAKLMGHVQDAPPKLSRLRRGAPKQLETLLGRMLAKDPDKRFSTPAELADALGPLTVEKNLTRLYSKASGKPPVEADQADASTSNGQTSKRTRFVGKSGRRSAITKGAGASRHPRHKVPTMWIAVACLSTTMLVATLAVVAWMMTRDKDTVQPKEVAKVEKDDTEPTPDPVETNTPSEEPEDDDGEEPPADVPPAAKKQFLIVPWPADQADDSSLMIDTRTISTSKAVDPDNSEQLRIEVTTGTFEVQIVRRGFEPYEQTAEVNAGQTVAIVPRWKRLPGLGAIPIGGLDPDDGSSEPGPGLGEFVNNSDPDPEPRPEPPPEPVADPAVQVREEQWLRAMVPVNERTAIWDFAGATAVLETVELDDPALQQRLARRRDDIKRMAAIKAGMIAAIKAAPSLKKSDLMLKGLNGGVSGADDTGIHTMPSSGRMETIAWGDINEKARAKLLQLAVDPSSKDDWIGGGLTAIAADDTLLAERMLAKAKSMGVDIAPYLDSVALAAYAAAADLLERKHYAQSQAAFEELMKAYGDTPWYAEAESLIVARHFKAKRGVYNREAEEIYAKAAALYRKEAFIDLKRLVEQLNDQYPWANLITDDQRSPSFAELELATKEVGVFVTVRIDGRGDYKTIQEALDNTASNSVIEIQDNGPYFEKIVIPRGSDGITLRGGEGNWPVIMSGGPVGTISTLVYIGGRNITLKRLVMLHKDSGGGPCLKIESSAHLQSLVTGGKAEVGPHSDLKSCLLLGGSSLKTPITVQDAILCGGNGLEGTHRGAVSNTVLHNPGNSSGGGAPVDFQFCTLNVKLQLHPESVVTNSILGSVQAGKPGTRFEFCNVTSGKWIDAAKPGRNCFSAPAQYVDPKNRDYRLKPTSPCRGRASDGGDLGVRYTPEMVEILHVALQLKHAKLISF